MIGKWIIIFGLVLVVVGAVVWLVEILGLPLGRLPGDIRVRGEDWSFSFPITTSIVEASCYPLAERRLLVHSPTAHSFTA